MLTLLIDGSVSPTPSQDEIQDRRPVPWGIRIPIGGVQRLFLPRVAWGVAGAGGGAVIGACLGGALEGSGVTGASAADAPMCGRLSVRLISSKCMVAMLRRSILTTTSSKLMYQVSR